MTPPPRQITRLDAFQSKLNRQLLGGLRGDWRTASLALLALLIGFYLGQNLPMLMGPHFPGGRPALVLALVLLLELVVRVRSRAVQAERPMSWVVADNLRIGAFYAVVLESFKLGS